MPQFRSTNLRAKKHYLWLEDGDIVYHYKRCVLFMVDFRIN